MILGGGDGLALREILKYRRCAAADLADHDPDVIEHARTTFSQLNCRAFDDRRVSVFTEDAESYLRRSNELYDLIISDFTFPNTPETARLFTSDFFIRIGDRLSDTGIFSMNTVSPTRHDKAYQAIFNTLNELKLNPLPLKFSIPSFANHGYGQWGFFFGSRTVIALSELKNWKTKVKTRFIRKDRLSESLNSPLTISDSDIIRTPSDMLNLLGVPIPFNVSPTQIDRDWVVRLLNILRSMDIGQLFDEVNRRTEHLSASLQEQFRYLRKELPLLLKEQVINIERAGQVLSVLMLIIIAVNLLCPDNMYAKGYSSGSSGGSFISQEQPTLFHSKALQMATLAYAINMQGKRMPKSRSRCSGTNPKKNR
ncbi:MAG: fused MFS/spermidine synthase [Desulfobacteraceae bacterium]|nr:fused MFS/spermidine synthase [Desulfobacteraceae bacterium]